MAFPIRTVQISLTLAKCQHFALLSTVTYWPDDAWRAKLIEAARHTDYSLVYEFRVNAQELWLMETLLLARDPRSTKLPDGSIVMVTLHKVWDALVKVYNGGVVIREVPHDSGTDNENDHNNTGTHRDGCETAVQSK